MKKSPPPSAARLFLPLLVTGAAAGAILLAIPRTPSTPPKAAHVIDIGIEHTKPLRLSLTLGTGKIPGILELTHDGDETALLSLPDAWELREVRNAAAKDIPADAPSFGFRRWHVPPGAILSLSLPSPPDGLVVHNPSGIPINLQWKKIDLQSGTTEEDVRLMQGEALRVW